MNGENLLILSFTLFFFSLTAFLVQKNLLITLMALELSLNAANIALVNFSFTLKSEHPLIWVFILFSIAAAEAAIGLSILMAIAKKMKTLRTDDLNRLKG